MQHLVNYTTNIYKIYKGYMPRMPSQQKQLIKSEKYFQENVGQERYASIISETQYVFLLTGEWQQWRKYKTLRKNKILHRK